MSFSLQSSLGITFQRDRLFLVNLKRLVREVVLDCYEEISLPAELTEEESQSFCAQAISRFMREHALGQENVWVSIPRTEVLLRFLNLPATAEENLQEVIRYEVGKYIPYAEEDIFIDFLVLEREEAEKRLRLLLLAVEKKVLERYLAILRQAGITPCGAEVGTSSVLNFYLLGKNGADGESPVALVEVGTLAFELSWLKNGIPRYSRAVNFGSEQGLELSQLLSSEFQDSFRGAFPLQTWKSPEVDTPVTVYCTGTEPTEDFLARMGELSSGAAVHPLPIANVAERLNFSQPIPPILAGAVGVALRGILKVPWEVNLLPRQLRKKTSRFGTYASLALVLIALLLSLGWAASTIVQERLELRTIEGSIGALKDEVNALEKLQKEAQELVNKMENLNDIQGSYYSKVEVLRELSTILPPEVWLTDLRCYRKEVDISGFAESSSGLIAIIDGSPLFASSEFTAPITRDIEGKERFKLKTTIEKQ